MEKIILHSDMNSFYANVECLYNPGIKDKPVAVGGDVKKRHGIVLAKNQAAKMFGVKTGEALWQAKAKCPGIIFVPPNFGRYKEFSDMAREIYNEYTDMVEPMGLDECWLDISNPGTGFTEGERVADEIRERIKSELGITVSIGVSFNKVFAKLGSDYKKPNATTVITAENFREILWPLPAGNMLYVGRASQKTLQRLNIHTIGDLARAQAPLLKSELGVAGVMLWQFANGLDKTPVGRSRNPVKSVGNGITLPYDISSEEDAKIVLMSLSESVAERLRDYGFICSVIQIGIREKDLYYFERQGRLTFPGACTQDVFNKAFELYKDSKRPGIPVRSLTVRAAALAPRDLIQMSMLPEFERSLRDMKIDEAMDSIRRRFGGGSILRGMMLLNPELAISRNSVFADVFSKN